MILLLTNYGDYSTDIIIDYLKLFKVEFMRINSFDLLNNSLQISINKSYINFNGKILNTKNIRAVWFRKFGFFRKSLQSKTQQKLVDSLAQAYFSTEFSRVITIFESYFKEAFWLTNPNNIILNKFLVLKLAQNIGFKIPETYVVNDAKLLENIKSKETKIISKSIYDPLMLKMFDRSYSMYTTIIEDNDLSKIPKRFLPSMVQQAIEKEYEIRVFFLMNKCYSMAIMSQDDDTTRIDYRKYNINLPNRFLPYKLPSEIEQNIVKLMNKLELNTGSLDFIVDRKGNYIFLEINPTGQFGMVDFPCNYGLHKKVAELLVRKDKK